MRTLFVAWQSPVNRSWFTVGKLSSSKARFRFEYTHGARHARKFGFRYFPAFPDLRVTYESERLFPFFANRLLSRSRREYKEFVKWVSSHEREEDPVALLARSGGARMTDSLELFPAPKKRGGEYHLHFFVHGLRHMPVAAANRAEQLVSGERLLLAKDVQNPHDPRALLLRTGDDDHEQDVFFVGYLPRYLAQDVSPILEESTAQAYVLRMNPPPAPIQFRVLCCFRIRPPSDFSLFDGEEFTPIADSPPRALRRRSLGPASSSGPGK
jgi:hypothetical protein